MIAVSEVVTARSAARSSQMAIIGWSAHAEWMAFLDGVSDGVAR
jgi:hypothetical protein